LCGLVPTEDKELKLIAVILEEGRRKFAKSTFCGFVEIGARGQNFLTAFTVGYGVGLPSQREPVFCNLNPFHCLFGNISRGLGEESTLATSPNLGRHGRTHQYLSHCKRMELGHLGKK
jgi:hypothetical protein